MKLTLLLSLATIALPALSIPLDAKRQTEAPDSSTITRLAPDLGFQSGANPDGTGYCDGAVNGSDGKPVKVPCTCPPAQDVYIPALIKNVQAGYAVNNPSVKVSFPTSDSADDQSARINAAIVTLQNLNGPGQGCPVASTKLESSGTNADSSPATNASPASNTPAKNPVRARFTILARDSTLDAATITQLAPDLGFQSGANPDGTGYCDGAVNGSDGKPVKIPCTCPPAQDVYINALIKNVQAGDVVNNPSVKITFPTDGSNQSKIARINAALATLENLNGPGQGCPAASTTLTAQQNGLGA